MSDHNRKASLRPRPPTRARPAPSANAMILYDVGKSIRKSDRNTLQELLDQFHADDAEVTYKKHTCRLQALCTQVRDNATIYLTLDDGGEDLGQ